MDRSTLQTLSTWGLIIGVVIILAIGGYYFMTNRYSTFSHSAHQFEIKYPSNWNKAENSGGATVIFYAPTQNSLDNFRENVNVVVQDLRAKPMGIAEYTRLAILQMKVVFKDKITVLESSETTLDGLPAWKFIFIGHGPEADIQYRSVWTVRDFTAYQITYTSVTSQYDTYLNQVKKMVKSFHITSIL